MNQKVQMKKGMGGHQRAFRGDKDEWLTPPDLIELLGPFDLDPCSPVNRPWDTAKKHYTIEDDGILQPWAGRVWLNPPYGPSTGKWLNRLADHGNGTALVFARTETQWFHETVWKRASGLLFLKGRLHFYHVTGEQTKHNAGAPSVVIAYGKHDAEILSRLTALGAFVGLR